MVDMGHLDASRKLSKPFRIVSIEYLLVGGTSKILTAVHILNHRLGLGASRGLGISLRCQAGALVQVAASIERPLKGIALPTK